MGKRKQDRIIPHAPIRRLANAQGIKRISKDAIPVIEEEMAALLADAKLVATHCGRQTVQKRDLKLLQKVKGMKGGA